MLNSLQHDDYLKIVYSWKEVTLLLLFVLMLLWSEPFLSPQCRIFFIIIEHTLNPKLTRRVNCLKLNYEQVEKQIGRHTNGTQRETPAEAKSKLLTPWLGIFIHHWIYCPARHSWLEVLACKCLKNGMFFFFSKYLVSTFHQWAK